MSDTPGHDKTPKPGDQRNIETRDEEGQIEEMGQDFTQEEAVRFADDLRKSPHKTRRPAEQRRKRTFIGLAGVLLVAIVAVVLVMSLEPAVEETPIYTRAPKVEITHRQQSDVKSIKIESAENLEFYREADTDSFLLRGWEDAPLATTPVNDLVSVSSWLDGERLVVENATDEQWAEYGLNDPVSIVTITYFDNSVITYRVGGVAPDNTYYLARDDSRTVYTVWMNVGNLYSTYGLNGFWQLPTCPVVALNLIEVKLTNPSDRNVHLIFEPNVYGGYEWIFYEPYREHPANATATDEYIPGFLNIKPTKLIDARPADLADYGLAEPKMTLYALDDLQNSITIQIGGMTEDGGYYYILYGEDGAVYQIEKAQMSFTTIATTQIAQRFITERYIANVDKVEIIMPEESVELVIKRIAKLDANGKEQVDDDGNLITEDTFYLDGDLINTKAARKFYQTVIGIAFDGEVRQDVSGQAVYSIAYTSPQGVRDVYEYIPYQIDNYAALHDGEDTGLYVRKYYFDVMRDSLNDLRSGALDE